MITRPIRLKVTAHMCDNISYLEVHCGLIRYMAPCGTPVALSNIASDAAVLRFRLADATSEGQIVKIAREMMNHAKKVELLNL